LGGECSLEKNTKEVENTGGSIAMKEIFFRKR